MATESEQAGASGMEISDGDKEIVRRVNEDALGTWHGATGWMVGAAVLGGPTVIFVNFAGKKMRWKGVIGGPVFGGVLNGMAGVIYVEPEELKNHRWITIAWAALFVGDTKIEIWRSDKVGFAGNLVGAGIGAGVGFAAGYGEWTDE